MQHIKSSMFFFCHKVVVLKHFHPTFFLYFEAFGHDLIYGRSMNSKRCNW